MVAKISVDRGVATKPTEKPYRKKGEGMHVFQQAAPGEGDFCTVFSVF